MLALFLLITSLMPLNFFLYYTGCLSFYVLSDILSLISRFAGGWFGVLGWVFLFVFGFF